MPKGTPGRAVCSIDGCDGLVDGRGYCGRHYKRWRKYGDAEREPNWRRNDYDPVTGLKHCTGCDRDLPVVAYSPDQAKPDGLRTRCRACRRGVYEAWYEANREQHNERSKRWYIENRQRMRAYDKARYNDERREQNRLAHRANRERRVRTNAEWLRNNPERKREYNRRRRARRLSRSIGIISNADLAAKFAYWGDRCWMCGADGLPLEVDHVKPLSKGGLHVLGNIRPACKPCNSSKRDRWPVPL